MRDLEQTIRRLCELSQRAYVNPYEAIDWPDSLGSDELCMSPELISLFGSPVYESLTDEQRARLSLYEAVAFFSLNIHGERALVAGLSSRLHEQDFGRETAYLHHFLDEENKHMIYFGTFCLRYAGKIYPDCKVGFARDDFATGEEDLLFFTKILIFEEIVDVYNVRMAKDERLAPVARRINLLHHQDETRHLVFGRQLVQELFAKHAPSWSHETLARVRSYLSDYLVATWREYYSPRVYRDAGIADPYGVYTAVQASAAARAHRRSISENVVRFLQGVGLLDLEPAL